MNNTIVVSDEVLTYQLLLFTPLSMYLSEHVQPVYYQYLGKFVEKDNSKVRILKSSLFIYTPKRHLLSLMFNVIIARDKVTRLHSKKHYVLPEGEVNVWHNWRSFCVA